MLGSAAVTRPLIILTALLLLSTNARADGWVPVSEPNAFSFELPAKPERTTRTRRTGLGNIEDIRFESKRGEGLSVELWHVSVSVLPERMLEHPADDIIEASWRGGFGRPAGARPVPGKKPGKAITLRRGRRAHRGRRYVLDSGGLLTSSAFYLVGDRLFAFHYMRGSGAKDEKRFDRLLASFELSTERRKRRQ